jgi:hypothetical protein
MQRLGCESYVIDILDPCTRHNANFRKPFTNLFAFHLVLASASYDFRDIIVIKPYPEPMARKHLIARSFAFRRDRNRASKQPT